MHFLKHNNKLTTCLMVITTLAMMTIANAQIPTPPRDLDQICEPMYLERAGPRECETACSAAMAAGCKVEATVTAVLNMIPNY